jgi:hypothetical protein
MAATVVIALLTVSLALVIAWAVRTDRENKRRIRRLADALGAAASGTGGAGVFGGIAYRFVYTAGSNNRPSAFKVSVESLLGQPFQVVREGRAQRLSKQVGLSAEIQTGDPAFDAEFYIETDALEFTRSLLMRDAARQAVRAIFRLGFTAVRQQGQVLQAVWSPFKLRDDIDPSVVTGILTPLATLARDMPVVPTAAPARRISAKAITTAAMATMVVLLGLSVGAGRFRPLDDGAVMRDSLNYSIPLLVLWLAFAFRQLKGRSTAHRELGLVALTSLIGFVLGGNALETIINGWADAAPPSAHEAEVIRTYSSSGHSTAYHVVLRSWRRQHQAENLTVSSGVYHTATPHRHITVVTKPGRLGFEWIVSYTLGPPTG